VMKLSSLIFYLALGEAFWRAIKKAVTEKPPPPPSPRSRFERWLDENVPHHVTEEVRVWALLRVRQGV
jgi:hypothetical protein